MEKTQENYQFSRSVTVDGKTSVLAVGLVFKIGKGGPNVSIKPQITTKQLSYNDDERAAVIRAMGDLTSEAAAHALHLIDEWMGNQRPGDADQLNLLDAIADAKAGQDVDEEEGVPGGANDGEEEVRVKVN